MADLLPSGLLEICATVGASSERLEEICQVLQKGGGKNLPSLEPEVLTVHVPPFFGKDDAHPSQSNFSRNHGHRSFRKKKEKPAVSLNGGVNSDPKEPASEDVSVPKNIDLLGLPQLCFPGGLHVAFEPKEDQFHFLVFTDVFGNRTFGIVAHCYQAIQEGYHMQNGQMNSSLQVPKSNVYRAYVPFGICVISKLPYYNAFKDCLSCLLVHLKSCKEAEFDDQIKDFAAKLALIPSPPPGPLHLVFHMKPLQIVLPSREDPDSPIVDLDLHLPFLCFKTKQILQIITCILMEQRIVFFSSDWALLTLMAECFMLYLHPLQWQHTFVPILSREMLDFVMAPTSFLMGCHIDYFEEVNREGEDLILIDINNGRIVSSKSPELEAEIPDVPLEPAETFKSRIESLQMHYDLELCRLNSSTDLSELRMRRRIWQQNLNWEIQQIALQLIVDIFRDVADHLNYEHRVFNSEEFLKSREIIDHLFYKKVLETYIFHSFLKARLSRRIDAFTRMELSTRSEAHRLKLTLDSPRRPTIEEMVLKQGRPDRHLNKRLVVSMPNLQDDIMHDFPTRQFSLRKMDSENAVKMSRKSIKTFKLPEISSPFVARSVQWYYAECVHLLTKAIGVLPHENSGLLARYLYLRGLMYVLQEKRLEALSDFQDLYKTDLGIFPGDLVKKVVKSMAQGERSLAERRTELKRLISQVIERERDLPKPEDHVKKFELPKTHMHQNDFVKRIQESGIVKDTYTIHRLFEALTVGQQKQIDPETFKDFYTFWKETEVEAQDVNLPSEVIEHLDKNECVYKLSSSVKTNNGVGKIAMTQKRLFLLTEGRPGYVEIAKFRDIEDVKCISVALLLLRIPLLRIKSVARKGVFDANLKSECDLWHLIVKEMWAGRKMADAHKDPQYIQQALTNVLLMDAVVGCRQNTKAIFAASKLAFFDKMKNEVPMMVSKTTSETLKHKINPSVGQTSPQVVDVLLYTPGHLGSVDADVDAHPKLWCGLSEGKVVVFDAATWSIQQHCIQVGSSKLNCMLGLEESQVWIGSENSTIYLINTRSMSCNKQLTGHRSGVTDIVIEDRHAASSERQAFSCSVDGTVIAWHVSTLKVKNQFQLQCQELISIKLYKNMLWCCTGDSIIEVKKNGLSFRQMVVCDHLNNIHLPFSCFHVLPERDEFWTACSNTGELCIWNIKPLPKPPPQRLQLQDCTGVNCMIKVKNQIWVGGRGISQGKPRGKIYVIDIEKISVEKELVAHMDVVQALCSAEDRYVLSGAGSEDGRVAIWNVE
ncbi:DENN domain-containing protein 3 isoform X2 [Latimeria chalumnae]|uniref:DENN domain-containing protein 3 isoform X2 n=1 Tax=Latimeria chalumnae TaxID=7897 RepID=UPI00313C0C81